MAQALSIVMAAGLSFLALTGGVSAASRSTASAPEPAVPVASVQWAASAVEGPKSPIVIAKPAPAAKAAAANAPQSAPNVRPAAFVRRVSTPAAGKRLDGA